MTARSRRLARLLAQFAKRPADYSGLSEAIRKMASHARAKLEAAVAKAEADPNHLHLDWPGLRQGGGSVKQRLLDACAQDERVRRALPGATEVEVNQELWRLHRAANGDSGLPEDEADNLVLQ